MCPGLLLIPMVVAFLLQRLHSYTNSSLSIFLELRVDSSVNLQAIRIKAVWFARLLQMLATPGDQFIFDMSPEVGRKSAVMGYPLVFQFHGQRLERIHFRSEDHT